MAEEDNIIDTCNIIIGILLPPLGVYLKKNCEAEFWICLLLTILGYIPGMIYAAYIISTVVGSIEKIYFREN